MYSVVDKVLGYVIERGVPFIILLVILYLIYRYYTYGQGNKTLICPSVFGNTYNANCLKELNYVVDLQGNLIKQSEI